MLSTTFPLPIPHSPFPADSRSKRGHNYTKDATVTYSMHERLRMADRLQAEIIRGHKQQQCNATIGQESEEEWALRGSRVRGGCSKKWHKIDKQIAI